MERTTKFVLHVARWAHSTADLERARRLREVARAYRVSVTEQARDVVPTRLLEELVAIVEEEAERLTREALIERPTPVELEANGLEALINVDGGTA